jgi:uncharacterized membrane-anchored protein YitT (DUF2179 family)
MSGTQELNLIQQQEAIMAKIQHRRLTKRKILQRILLITLGATLMAVGLEIFLVTNNVIDGGITGISIML